jgi:hypothetical protein
MDQWQQVAVVYTSSSLTFYKDGVSYGTFPITGTSTPYNLTLGDYADLGSGFFQGRIDEVRVYNRTLGFSEIRYLYDSNLNEYDPGRWMFFKNQSFGAFPYGVVNFTYFGCAKDTSGAEDCTDARIVTYNSTSCPIITASGTYVQSNDYTGAPNDASEMPLGGTACVKIAASDVIYDCNGHTISGSGVSGTTYGIITNGSLTNVTVKNCAGISSFSYGIYAYQTDNSTFINNTVSSSQGFMINTGDYNVIVIHI